MSPSSWVRCQVKWGVAEALEEGPTLLRPGWRPWSAHHVRLALAPTLRTLGQASVPCFPVFGKQQKAQGEEQAGHERRRS